MAMNKLVGAAVRRPGWADLPRDLLESVLGRLPVPDRLRFPGVCTAWQSADAASAHRRLPSVTTLPFVDASRDADGRVVSYDLRCCFGDGEHGDEVLVPPESFAPDKLRYELYDKAILVAPPRRQTPSGSWGGYAVLLICQPLYRLAIARAGDTRWTLLDTPSRCWVDAVRASSATDGHQAVYTLDSVGRVVAWDMDSISSTADTMTPKVIAPPCCCSRRACSMSIPCTKYLVELSPGHLLQVHRLRDKAHARKGGAGVLAGRALFLGKSASTCVPADCCPEVKGNCVYFTDDGPWSHERCHEVVPDVGVLDLADGSYKVPRGAVRDLLWKWPPPSWNLASIRLVSDAEMICRARLQATAYKLTYPCVPYAALVPTGISQAGRWLRCIVHGGRHGTSCSCEGITCSSTDIQKRTQEARRPRLAAEAGMKQPMNSTPMRS
uniref:F-box domain-containing protein n=1 Tax=Oryza brachyantha TaxID=4533 RepID=J3MHH0_ORYBR